MVKTLRQNIGNWIFLRSTDVETCELASFLSQGKFQPADISKLETISSEKSHKGPWYSEAIIYSYKGAETEGSHACKTKLPHHYNLNTSRDTDSDIEEEFERIKKKALDGLKAVQEFDIEKGIHTIKEHIKTKVDTCPEKTKRLATGVVITGLVALGIIKSLCRRK